MKKQIRIYIYIIGLILIDQLRKVWALSALRGTEGIAVIPNVFELSYLENRGAAFGILQDHQIFFVLITVAAAVILTWIYRRIPQTKKYIPLRISYALIMAGAFGNLIDRVFRGYVVDFFYFFSDLRDAVQIGFRLSRKSNHKVKFYMVPSKTEGFTH